MVRWPLAADGGEPVVTRHFAVMLAEYIQIGVVWQIAGGKAAAAWFPPSTADDLTAIDQRTRPKMVGLTDDGGARYAQMWDWVEEHLPTQPMWFLDFIGVDPQVQGQGLGRQLIEHGLAMAREESCPAFLETSNAANVGYYQSFGFSVQQMGVVPGGGPKIWFMACPPAT
jgi:ribosomal protein S18 acetylase RimI-like enzyme